MRALGERARARGPRALIFLDSGTAWNHAVDGELSQQHFALDGGVGLGLPIAKSLVDLHAGTFTLRSKLREGTEVIVTFLPERVMSALAPITDPAPPIQPGSSGMARHRPLLKAGT